MLSVFSYSEKSFQQQRKALHGNMLVGYIDITCSWLVNFRMWHRRLSTPPSWNTSSLASLHFFRMEKCNSFKRNLHRCVARNRVLGCLPTLMDFCLAKVQQQQQLLYWWFLKVLPGKPVTELHCNTFPEMSELHWIVEMVYVKLDCWIYNVVHSFSNWGN